MTCPSPLKEADIMTVSSLKRILSDYLSEHHLPKIACVTNCLPSREERRNLATFFNYVCFCASSRRRKVEMLFLAYLFGYRAIEYDVVVMDVEECLVRRQFSYACLGASTSARAKEILQYVAATKQSINRNYPVVVRMLCDDLDENIQLPGNIAVRAILSTGDLIYEVT